MNTTERHWFIYHADAKPAGIGAIALLECPREEDAVEKARRIFPELDPDRFRVEETFLTDDEGAT